jgi:hypothetical protein
VSNEVVVNAGGIDLVLRGATEPPNATVQENFRDRMIKARRMLGMAARWLGSVPGALSEWGRHQWQRQTGMSDMSDLELFRRRCLLEYCFGPVPDDKGAFKDICLTAKTVAEQTLTGLLTRGLTFDEETDPSGKGHVSMVGTFAIPFVNIHIRFGMEPKELLPTIIHEATHKFAGREDVFGDPGSYIYKDWGTYWSIRQRPQLGNWPSKMLDLDTGLRNADSYATFAVNLHA